MLYLTFAVSLILVMAIWLIKCRYHYFNIKFNQRAARGSILSMIQFRWQHYWVIFCKGPFNKPNWNLLPEKKHKLLLTILTPLLKLLLIICSCSLVFSLTQYYIDTHTHLELMKATIWEIEKTSRAINTYIKWLKPAFPYDILIAVLLVFFSSIFVLLKTIQKAYSRFSKILSTILLLLTIFTSFTFFGQRLGDEEKGRVGQLRFHAAEIISENELLLHDIREHQQDNTIKRILVQPKVKSAIDKYESLKKDNDSLKRYLASHERLSEDHQNLKPAANHLSEIIDASDKSWSEVEFSETEFQADYQEKKNTNFYDDVQKSEFKQYYEQHKDWFDHNVTTESTQAAEKSFKNDIAAESKIKSPWYESYKDPVKKMWKGFYGKTAKAWTKPFTDRMNERFPFFSEIFDVLVHDQIEDLAFDKAYEAYDTYLQNRDVNLMNLGSISAAKAAILDNVAGSTMTKASEVSTNIHTQLNEANQILQADIDRNFASLKSKDSWNNFRQHILLDIDGISCPYFLEKKDIFRQELTAWNNHLKDSKEQLYNDNIDNLEEFFFDYAKSDDNLMEAMGRAIAWYKPIELIKAGYNTNTVADAVNYYVKENNFEAGDISLLNSLVATAHACPPLIL